MVNCLLAGWKLFEPMSMYRRQTTSTCHEVFVDQLKQASLSAGVRGRPSVLLVHEELGDSTLTDVCTFINDGETVTSHCLWDVALLLLNYCNLLWFTSKRRVMFDILSGHQLNIRSDIYPVWDWKLTVLTILLYWVLTVPSSAALQDATSWRIWPARLGNTVLCGHWRFLCCVILVIHSFQALNY